MRTLQMTPERSESQILEGDNIRDCSVSFGEANIKMFLYILPPVALLMGTFGLLWGWRTLGDGFDRFFTLWIFLPTFALGIVIHELIHGITWAAAGRLPWSDIRFGFDPKSFTPYAHARRPIPVNAYRIGAAMPGLLTGVLPCLIALAAGSGPLMAAGLFFTFAAGGDLLVLWLSRKIAAGELVQDHPSRVGCLVVGSPR
jgi:hypothetical protein